MKLSVVIPAFNERRHILAMLARVQAVAVDKDVIVVDDGSTDGTRQLLEQLERAREAGRPAVFDELDAPLRADNVRVFFQPRNMGKGAAVRRGFGEARGDAVIVQDADLESDPNEYPKLLAPIEQGRAEVVYGSRFLDPSVRQARTTRYFANRTLTVLSNLFTGLHLTDMETCYKLMRRDVLDRLRLREDRFGFEPEITAKIGRLGYRVHEIQVSYAGRTHAEGKKIGWKDGVRALWCIVRYGLFD